MLYAVMDYSKRNEDDTLAVWPVLTNDFSAYLQQAQAYAKKVLKKQAADGVVRMLPFMENGDIRRIEIDGVGPNDALVFRASKEGE